MMDQNELLKQAQAGDIRAFHTLFAEFQPQLKSYLYRLLANRNQMEDVAHDVFILAFENLPSFRGEASLKTWVFTIATHHARRSLARQQRWQIDTLDRTRELAHDETELMDTLHHTNRHALQGAYEIREHIDYCFTCVSKMLPIDQQIALILKDIYDFKVREIAVVMAKTHGAVKHLLHNARKTMIAIFDDTCALVSKRGVCDQCSQLNGKFNPKQDRQAELMKIKLVKDGANYDDAGLYALRTELVKAIDPLQTNGADLHEVFLAINHRVNAGPD
jgi:RNA polymerase sigma-70 factor (ECF subfamily)